MDMIYIFAKVDNTGPCCNLEDLLSYYKYENVKSVNDSFDGRYRLVRTLCQQNRQRQNGLASTQNRVSVNSTDVFIEKEI